MTGWIKRNQRKITIQRYATICLIANKTKDQRVMKVNENAPHSDERGELGVVKLREGVERRVFGFDGVGSTGWLMETFHQSITEFGARLKR